MNTLQKGSVRYLFFKDKKTWYGVAFELNIVESGDDPLVVRGMLFAAIDGYLATVRGVKGARVNHVLNQHTDPLYEKMWATTQVREPSRKVPTLSPYQVLQWGALSV
jgi:hypothetical protein